MPAPVVHQFMLADVGGALLAVLTLSSVFFTPGYVFGYALNLFGFRTRRFAEQAVWSIAASFLIAPFACYAIGRMVGLNGLCIALVLTAAIALVWMARSCSFSTWTRGERKVTALFALGWTVYVLLMLVDFQHGARMYFSTVMADQSYRIAFTQAVVHSGIPPANPLYLPGSPVPMRYYYFWYVMCATAVKLAHVSARQAFIASSVWAGFGLLTTMQIFTTHFFHWERRLRRIAIALLAVMGADLLPAVGNAILQPSINGDIEWWSVDPIDGWPDSLLWVPHHVASVLCCLVVFLLIWKALSIQKRAHRFPILLLACLGCVSAFGLSVYVAFGFALMMAAWALRALIRKSDHRNDLVLTLVQISAVSLLLSLPFFWELTRGITPSSHAGMPNHLFTLSIRRMIDSGLLTGLPIFTGWNRAHPILLDQGIRLLLLVPGLAMELGLYGAVLVYALRDRKGQRSEEHRIALFFAVTGLVLTLFVSSSVISNNDFGYRAVMLPMFFLTLLAAEMLGDRAALAKPRRRTLSVLLVLGVAGTLYGSVLLRVWLPQETLFHPGHGYGATPTDEYQLRALFEDLDRIAPPRAVVAFLLIDPDSDRKADEVMTPIKFYQRMLVMDTGRQILNAELTCATEFGGDEARCGAITAATRQMYAVPSPASAFARRFCSTFGVDYLLASHRDAAWSARSGWMAELPIVAQQPEFAIYSCKP